MGVEAMSKEFKEAGITVNGVTLTVGQSMTIRVALHHFASDLYQDGLGDDDHGRKMTEQYQSRTSEIINIIMKP